MEKVGKMKTGKGEMEMWVEWEGRGETLATNFGETKKLKIIFFLN